MTLSLVEVLIKIAAAAADHFAAHLCSLNHIAYTTSVMPVEYSSYHGYGQTAKESAHYSQAVRIGDRIECAGQGKTF